MLERIKSVFDVENVGFKIHEFPLNLIEPRLVIQTHTPSASKLAFNRNLMRFIPGVKDTWPTGRRFSGKSLASGPIPSYLSM